MVVASVHWCWGAKSQLAPRFWCWLIQKDLAPQRDYFWLLQLIPEVYFYLFLISMKLEARTVSSRGAGSECYSKKSTRRLHPALLIILFQVLLALIPFLYSNGYQTGYHLCSSPRSLRLGLWFCAAAGGTGIAWQMAAATIYSGGQAAPGERCSNSLSGLFSAIRALRKQYQAGGGGNKNCIPQKPP